MPCLCGDPECPSCGPAQGLGPIRVWVGGLSHGTVVTETQAGPEDDAWKVHDWLELEILRQYRTTMPVHPYDTAVTLADRLGAYPEVAAAMAEAAAKWHKER